MNAAPLPIALTVAGSDSSGGAGIQADLKTFQALSTYGCSVVTALTAQNTLGVAAIHAPPADFVRAQMAAVLGDLDIGAAKTGMLFSEDIIAAVAEPLELVRFPVVVDPVCVSQSGHALLEDDAVDALRRRIIPLAALVTPNRDEASLLTGIDIGGRADAERAAGALLALGARAVLLKGGHFSERECRDWLGSGAPGMADVLFRPDHPPLVLPVARLVTRNNHGTGCTLSAAIAAHLARGFPLDQAVARAQAYLHAALSAAFPVGKGAGPVHHGVWIASPEGQGG